MEGRAAFVKGISDFLSPFPDIHITDLATLVDGNTVAVRYVILGTQKGDLRTEEGVIRATNRPIMVDGAEFMTFNKRGELTKLTTIERGDQLRRELTGK